MMTREHSLEETLDAIVWTARDSVPGMTHAGISIITKRGQIETKAATDPLVWELDWIQYTLGEGPCVSAMENTPVVIVPRIRQEHRWPRYVPRAVEHGLQSQLAVRLFLDDRGTIGGLNLYSTSQAEIDDDAEGIADLFAAHAAIALGHAREVDQLNRALNSRKVIGQAIGIVMERYRIDKHRALSFLMRASSHGNIKLRDIAAEIVDQVNHPGSDSPPPLHRAK